MVAAAALCLGCTTDPSTPAGPDEWSGRVTAVRALVRQGVADGVPGVVVVMADRDRHAAVSQGLARLSPRVPVTATVPFRIASLTKPMTATVVMRLVESGRLALDDTVEALAPGLLREGERITVEQLLSHWAAMPEVPEPLVAAGRVVPDAVTARGLSREGLDGDPGSLPVYRNSGYLVLSLLVERVTGRAFADVLEDEVLGPAGMATARLDQHLDEDDVVAHGYYEGEDLTHLTIRRAPAAGAVVAAATDVDRFAAALFAGELVRPATLRRMTRPHGVPLGDWADYGLGLARLDLPCGPAHGHGGRLP
ncbi:MAG TPA: serine hydrolase domain-containing protein, partial [Nocardioides sp.]|nr:serine hydrolase domain-containing protein [Nocardioides sp.]